MGRLYPHPNDTVMTAKKTLQINLKTIPETGLAVAIDLGPEWFARWHEEEADLLQMRLSNDKLIEIRAQEMLEPGDYP